MKYIWIVLLSGCLFSTACDDDESDSSKVDNLKVTCKSGQVELVKVYRLETDEMVGSCRFYKKGDSDVLRLDVGNYYLLDDGVFSGDTIAFQILEDHRTLITLYEANSQLVGVNTVKYEYIR